jgi:hypothetical protein
MSTILPQFLVVLPENLSFNRDQSFISCLIDEKQETNAATTGFASETFLLALAPRSKRATLILAHAKFYLTNDTDYSHRDFKKLKEEQ